MPYRRTEEVEQRLAGKRERILRAVRHIVADVGFRDTQISMVAAAAGVATGTVYRYFPSKGELLAEALIASSRRELSVVGAIADADGSPLERLEAAVHAFASRALKARRLAYAMIAEPVDVEVDQARLEYRRAFSGMFRQLIDKGVAAGELPAQDSEATAACLFGALVEGLVGPLAPGAVRAQESRLVETIVTFCLRAVGRVPAGASRGAPLRVIKTPDA